MCKAMYKYANFDLIKIVAIGYNVLGKCFSNKQTTRQYK